MNLRESFLQIYHTAGNPEENYDWYYYYDEVVHWPERMRRNAETHADIIGDIQPLKNFYTNNTYYPYFRLRGRPVTEQQAKEVILNYHTSSPFDGYKDNGSFWGWCHPDGTVGINHSIGCLYDYWDLLVYCFYLASEFPFLDFAAAFTTGCLQTVTVRNSSGNLRYEYLWYSSESVSYDEWRNSVRMGIHLHDGMFTFLDKKQALKLYDQYAKRYEKTVLYRDVPGNNPYEIDYYKYPENYQKLLKYDYLHLPPEISPNREMLF